MKFMKQKKNEEQKIEIKRYNNQQQIILEKKLMELEKKLQKLPELEMKNSILLEEKQLLIKQLLNMKQTTKVTPPPPTEHEAKVYRSIGCNSNETRCRDMAIECKANTRDIGINNKLDEPEITKMQTIITTLRDKLNEQTLIMQQQLIKPTTRDVAVMHQVDKVEEVKPKPELRDVAINHRTEVDNSELIEKHTLITNTYIKEIEMLRLENAKLSASLEAMIKKHSKVVVTRGTHALEMPELYSVGTNTKKTTTRDVQVMFTPKSRDVSLSTDRFYHTRDVGLVCNIGLQEQQEQMLELIEIKKKYELKVQESLKQIKSYRDVAIDCKRNETRSVSLGCNIVKESRDVSLRCDISREMHPPRDVCIECKIEDPVKEQKDASIYVNTLEPVIIYKETVKERRDFCGLVQMEDSEKSRMARELANLKLVVPKVTRDVAISVDHRSRLMDDLLRNQSSSMDTIKTFSRQVNTETKQTRDFSVDTSSSSFLKVDIEQLSIQKDEAEMEKNKLISVNKELKQRLREIEEALSVEKSNVATLSMRLEKCTEQAPLKNFRTTGVGSLSILDTPEKTHISGSLRLTAQSLSSFGGSAGNTTSAATKHEASTSSTDLRSKDEITIKTSRKETEYEQRKTTRVESAKKSQTETISLRSSSSEKIGDKVVEKITSSNSSTQHYSSPTGATSATVILVNNTPVQPSSISPSVRSEVKIPISKEDQSGSNNIGIKVNTCDENSVQSKEINNEQHTSHQAQCELKKPKGILKPTSMSTSGSSMGAALGSDYTRNSSEVSGEQPQRKALTFGENEIVEGFNIQSEQSGSEFSLDENSQNNTILPNEDDDDDEYITSTVTYETAVGEDGSTIIECQSNAEENIKNDKRKNKNSSEDFDDYELQEKLTSQSGDSSGVRYGSKSMKQRDMDKQQQEDEANESNVFELELELHIACAILNDSLYEPLKADKNKVARALNLIQQDWFKLAAKKDANPALVEEHLNAFYSRFSNLLLERIVNMADLNLNTALHYSVSNGNFEIVNLLLDTKVCDVNAQNRAGGYTSIMLAALVPVTGDYERMTLKRLFGEGNVNIKSTDNGQTALMLAVIHGNKETVSLLLEASADCNLQDKEGSTALMAACEHGHIDIVRILLDNTNCDPDIKDNDGETAFDIAKRKKRNDIIVLLYAHSSKLRSHHPAIQFSKSRPRIGSNGAQNRDIRK